MIDLPLDAIETLNDLKSSFRLVWTKRPPSDVSVCEAAIVDLATGARWAYATAADEQSAVLAAIEVAKGPDAHRPQTPAQATQENTVLKDRVAELERELADTRKAAAQARTSNTANIALKVPPADE